VPLSLLEALLELLFHDAIHHLFDSQSNLHPLIEFSSLRTGNRHKVIGWGSVEYGRLATMSFSVKNC
jgi:hypothetical protein